MKHILSLSFILIVCFFASAPCELYAQSKTTVVDINTISYKDGIVTMYVNIPTKTKKPKMPKVAMSIKDDVIYKIVYAGIERTPYNQAMQLDNQISFKELRDLIGDDISVRELYYDNKVVNAKCTFDIKYIERKLMDRGIVKKFGL